MRLAAITLALLCLGLLPACETTSTPKSPDQSAPPASAPESSASESSASEPGESSQTASDTSSSETIGAAPEIASPGGAISSGGAGPYSAAEIDAASPSSVPAPTATVSASPQAFMDMDGWSSADKTAALKAFQLSCPVLLRGDSNRWLHAGRKEFGRALDWTEVCLKAEGVDLSQPQAAQTFFESEFLPVTIDYGSNESLLTAYYHPEVEVRRNPDLEFIEPILAEPWSEATRTFPRRDINVASGHVIAYGRPIDVFFMQVQGSGTLRFDDGRRVRAAYAANNGHPYTSIGKVLIARGDLDPDKASKQDIEDWMAAAGFEKTRDLMNENSRYIFFREEPILDGQSTKGSMQVMLTDMGSLAIDREYYPYGVPIWLETRLPAYKGDYAGQPTGLLVVTQDTGSAIRGPYRGDIFFGAGDVAGDLAGVMKHAGIFTVLLPAPLALLYAAQS